MCSVDPSSKTPHDAADATAANCKPADGASIPLIPDYFSDPEVFRRVGQVIARSARAASGSKS
jgi:hypothetical protein